MSPSCHRGVARNHVPVAAYDGRELRITSVFLCVARGFKPRASFRFTGCCWWRPLAGDGSSGTCQGHVWARPYSWAR